MMPGDPGADGGAFEISLSRGRALAGSLKGQSSLSEAEVGRINERSWGKLSSES